MLVVRMWRDAGSGGEVQARIRHTLDVTAEEPRIVVVHGSGAVRDEVERWLDRLLEPDS